MKLWSVKHYSSWNKVINFYLHSTFYFSSFKSFYVNLSYDPEHFLFFFAPLFGKHSSPSFCLHIVLFLTSCSSFITLWFLALLFKLILQLWFLFFSLPFLALPGISLVDSWGAFILSLCHDRVQWDLLKLFLWIYLLPVTIRNSFPLKHIEEIKFRPCESMYEHREAQKPSAKVQLLIPHLDLDHGTSVKIFLK